MAHTHVGGHVHILTGRGRRAWAAETLPCIVACTQPRQLQPTTARVRLRARDSRCISMAALHQMVFNHSAHHGPCVHMRVRVRAVLAVPFSWTLAAPSSLASHVVSTWLCAGSRATFTFVIESASTTVSVPATKLKTLTLATRRRGHTRVVHAVCDHAGRHSLTQTYIRVMLLCFRHAMQRPMAEYYPTDLWRTPSGWLKRPTRFSSRTLLLRELNYTLGVNLHLSSAWPICAGATRCGSCALKETRTQAPLAQT